MSKLVKAFCGIGICMLMSLAAAALKHWAPSYADTWFFMAGIMAATIMTKLGL